MILVLVALSALQSRAAALTKEHFLSLTSRIDSATATAMAENLANADWYEMDSAALLDALNATLDARKRFAWGKTVPKDIYQKYVVPLRVSNEPLQPFRRKLLHDIGPRLDSLKSLARAALEVNLYLGERVGFKPTDKRDQGPLTTLSCGFGRCGELVILAVDAMRSVGIPARGVYVPYWSAFDNNHAWIEVYTEDGWKYMGACEPATRLDKAWFDRAVQRAGIVLTMGSNYHETDSNVVKTGSGYRLNVIGNYVSPARLTVEMPESWGKEDHLWLALFNFGALHPLVELVPKDKIAMIELGNGDFVLMGLYEGKLFFQPFTARMNHESRVRLDVAKKVPQDFTLTYPWPPASNRHEPDLIPKDRIEIARVWRRVRDEKRAWERDWLDRFIREGGNFSEKLYETLKRSPGNEATVLDAVLDTPPEWRKNAIFIVSLLSNKDLREVNPKVLARWLMRTPGRYGKAEKMKSFVLNPQIGYEAPGTGLASKYATNLVVFTSLGELRDEVARYSSLVDTGLGQRPLPPITIDHMLADGIPISADNVALWWTDRLRRSGIPARRTPFSDWLEFYFEGRWLPLFPGEPQKLGDRDALPEVKAHYEDPATVKLQWKEATSPPKWKSDFLFLPIEEDGLPDYRHDLPEGIKRGNDMTVVTLDPGQYLFMAGRRNGRGDVAVKIRIVTLESEENRAMTLNLVPPPEPPPHNRNLHLQDLEWKPKTSRGKHLLIILGDNEPSKRVRDQARKIKADGITVDLISNIGQLSSSDKEKMGLKNRDEIGTPYVYCFDGNGMLLFTQSGYDLNLANRVRNTQR
jgi:hypothetical protein